MALSLLARAEGLLIDLDGTVYQNDRLLEGVGDTLAWLRASGIPLRFVTNTTMRSRAMVARRLQELGVAAQDRDISNPASVAAGFLREKGASAYVLVLDDALSEFEGVVLDHKQPDYVVIGDMGRGWTFDAMNHAFRLILEQDAGFIALGKSRYWRAADGLQLDSGPFVTALEYASGHRAMVMGKPERTFFTQAVAGLGLSAEKVAMIGDDIDTDVAGARDAGLITVLVKSGKYRPEDLAKGIWPDYVLNSLADIRGD